MILSNIKIAIGYKEGFMSSLNLQFPNGLMLGTKVEMIFTSKAETKKLRDQFIEVCKALGVSEEEIKRIG